jgi:hypothetical protein
MFVKAGKRASTDNISVVSDDTVINRRNSLAVVPRLSFSWVHLFQKYDGILSGLWHNFSREIPPFVCKTFRREEPANFVIFWVMGLKQNFRPSAALARSTTL